MFHNSTAIHPRPNTLWPGDDLSSINTEDTIIGSLKNGGELDQSKVFLVISSRQSLDNPVDGGGIQSFSLDELGPTFNLPPSSPLQNFAKKDANLILEKDARPAPNQFCSDLHKNKEDNTLTESHNNGAGEVMTFYVTQSKVMECVEEETTSYCLEVIGPTLDSDMDASKKLNISKNDDVKEAEVPPPEQEPPKLQLRFPIKLPSKDFCFNHALPELELVFSFDDKDEEEQVVKFKLDPFLQSSSQQERPRTDATDEDNGNNNGASLSPPSLSPPSSNGRGSDQSPIIEINLDDLPKRKLRQPPRIQLPTTTTSKKVGDQGKIKRRAVPHNPKDKVDVKAGWRHSCYFSNKRFRCQADLDQHLIAHTKEKPHPCNKCRKQFNLKSSLTTHQRLHDPATRRPFHCEECDKSFTQKAHLTRHMTTVHLRLKQFQCPECDQKFGQKCTLTTHLSGVHLGMRYPCPKPHCDKSFSEKGNLRKHEKRAH